MKRFWKKHCLEVPVYALLIVLVMCALSFAAEDDLAEAKRADEFMEKVIMEGAAPKESTTAFAKEEPTLVSLGEYKITYYCRENYPHICNNGDMASTATGTVPTPGRTIAVDPKVIPYGTEVVINGHMYIAEDCGGAVNGNKVDILVDTHEEALKCGIDYCEVFVVKELMAG